MKTIFVKPLTLEKKWYLIDAEGKELGRVATAVAHILRGKNKRYYTPHQDMGDHVIIINAEKAALTGKKRTNKLYYRHSGYPGGLRQYTYEELLERNPVLPMELAIKGMLPKGKLGRQMFTKLRVYAGNEHRQQAQQPIKIEI
ncbi:MAG TPA: 50S ribosomal protein L13 [Sphaerochaeta sp.]|nr:50S ribosomal protein L13 [Sphaerochaeta sp.]